MVAAKGLWINEDLENIAMKLGLLSAAVALLAATTAYSADVYQPEPMPITEAPEVVVSEASGWYLRGDIGYSFNDMKGAKYFQGSNANSVDFASADLKDSFLLGAGVGYQVNNYLRTDVTFDYLTKADFSGSTRGSCGVAGDCTSTDVSSMTVYSLLANAYVDLGTYGAVTPYVGAGIGGSYVKWKDLHNTSCDTADPTSCDPTVDHDGKGNWRLTYALMAGASIDVTCNIKADVGYRFRHISGGDMFGYNLGGGPGQDKGFNMHEARVGARYAFGGCDQPVAYEPPPQPIVYK